MTGRGELERFCALPVSAVHRSQLRKPGLLFEVIALCSERAVDCVFETVGAAASGKVSGWCEPLDQQRGAY